MKKRLDILLVEKNFFPSRERAKAAVMEGLVLVDGLMSDKPGNLINEASLISVKQTQCPYVSRGGLKLENAIREFGLKLSDFVCMDVGASTGGFTDCMLMNGAKQVYAIDVGYGQLAWKLRQDDRVVVIEKCNFRYFDDPKLRSSIDFISIDVSFISLSLILPVASKYMAQDAGMVCLIKPQFEAGREQVGKRGIVREPKIHEEVIAKIIASAEENGLFAHGLTYSPITGAKGNIEYLLHLNKGENIGYNVSKQRISDVVISAHDELS